MGSHVPLEPELVEMAGCDAQHIGRVTPETAPEGGSGAPLPHGVTHVGRATQTIPPAVRREVIRRCRGACSVPGCRNRNWLDVHHLDPRAEGGQHDPERLTVLCGAHHKALHRGFLILSGSVSTGLEFHHADGTSYGASVAPERVQASQLAFGALRRLGFAETETRTRLARALAHVGDKADVGTLVRQALALG